jgi:hypothetical protein
MNPMPRTQNRFVASASYLKSAQHLAFLNRKRRKPGEPEGEPVEPNRPNTLSGGAAAELEFDD